MASGRSLSLLASIAALVLAIAAALSIPSTANAHLIGGPCVKITMVSADASYKLHLVNENSTKLGLNNRQVGSSVVLKVPERIGILIDHTGEVKWDHKHFDNGQIGFEDHIDNDFNDAVIRVESVSCPSRNSGPPPSPTTAALEVSFSEAAHTVNEGNSVTIMVNVSPDADRSVEVPVSISSDDAESGDYSVSGLTGGKLSFASGDGSASFTIAAVEDSDSGAETVDLSFGSLPSRVSEGTQSTAQVTIEDPVAALEVSFSEAAYTVNEGNSVTITVNVSPDADRSVEVPVSISSDDAESGDYSVSGLTGGKLSFASGDGSASFTITTAEDSDREVETIDLSFGELPESVSEGTQATAQVNIKDTTPAPISNTGGGRSEGGGAYGILVRRTNQPPVFTEGANTQRFVAEDVANLTNLGAPVSATDPDGDTLIYTLEGPDAASFLLNSANGQLATGVALDYEAKVAHFLIMRVHDGHGGRDTIVVTVRVTDVAEQQAVVQAPVPTPEPQLVETPTPVPTDTVVPSPTPEPTATLTPIPTDTVVASPTPEPWLLWLRWLGSTSTPVPSPTATPFPAPTEEPTATPDLSGDSQPAIFAQFQDGGSQGGFQSTNVKSSVSPLPEEGRHLRIWPIILIAIGITIVVISVGMLISGGANKGEFGNRDLILNS